MTCIAAVVKDGVVYMGGDCAGVSGQDLTLMKDDKVFIVGPMLIGYTTSFRMGQLLRYALDVPHHPDGMPDDAYMATLFIDAVRACLKEGGYALKEKEQESGGAFLVGYHGKLFMVDSDYQVLRPRDDYHAMGCGAAAATGSLFSTWDRMPWIRLEFALGAAEHCNVGVRGPFTYLRLPALDLKEIGACS